MDNVQGFGVPLPLQPSWVASSLEKPKPVKKAPKKKKAAVKKTPKKPAEKIRTENLPWN